MGGQPRSQEVPSPNVQNSLGTTFKICGHRSHLWAGIVFVSKLYGNDKKKDMDCSQTSLRRTPSGPASTVRLREVSILERCPS